MKNIFYFFLFLVLNAKSQEATISAPSLHDIPNSGNFFTIVDYFNEYWKDKDIMKKGTGYKFFKRWEQFWQGSVGADGKLPSADVLANRWLQINGLNKKTRGIGGDWHNLGPSQFNNAGSYSSGNGRINVVRVSPINPAVIYVGAPNGGLWKSTDAGNSWIPLTDFLPVIGISGIALDKNNPAIIYISTGDRDLYNSLSNGVYKSIDGGLSWTHLNINFGSASYYYTGDIEIDPSNSNIIYLASSEGLYRSTDAGLSWTKKINTPCFEIRFKPNQPNTIYVVSSWYPISISKSVNGGNTFSIVLTTSLYGRALIDVTPADPEILYLFCANETGFLGLFKSVNSANSFTLQNSTASVIQTNQARENLGFCVSPNNPNELYCGELFLSKSTDGGLNWSSISDWINIVPQKFVHADVHDLILNGNKLYCANDGGLWVSNDFGLTYENKSSGLIVGQYYRMDLSANSSEVIAGGLQDNGGFFRYNSAWNAYHGADGMDAAVDPTNSGTCYGFIQNGAQLHKYDAINGTSGIIAGIPVGVSSGSWITELETGMDGTIYAGYNDIYKLDGSNWVNISNKNYPVRVIEADPSNANRLIFFSDSIYELKHIGANYLMKAIGSISSGLVTSIAISETQPDHIYYTTYDAIFKTENNGLTWSNITYNLSGLQVMNAIAHQKNSLHNSLYLATDNSIFYLDDTLNQWIPYNEHLPNTKVTDIEVNSQDGFVVASTYGRGIWRSPVAGQSLGIESTDYATNVLLYPNPCSSYFQINMKIEEPVVMNIFGVNGQKWFSNAFDRLEANTRVDVSHLPKGIYIVDIVSRSHLIRKKLCIR